MRENTCNVYKMRQMDFPHFPLYRQYWSGPNDTKTLYIYKVSDGNGTNNPSSDTVEPT